MCTQTPKPLDETSPSVQVHLGILQGVIQRMANNSAACKTWCITIVSAVIVMVADKGKPDLIWIALLPTILFFALDTYYLSLEKAFRKTYENFVNKTHTNNLTVQDLYSIVPSGDMLQHQRNSIKSFSIWGFYVGLFILIWITRNMILT